MNASDEWQADSQADPDSVYEFLYRNTKRIDLLLAQFEGVGSPKEHTYKEGREHADSEKEGSKAELKAGFGVGPLASVEVKAGADSGDSSVEKTDKSWATVYDQDSINTLRLFDHLRERRMIQEDPEKARIGQLILYSGSLALYDYSLFHRMLETPTWRSKFEEGMRKFHASHGSKGTEASDIISTVSDTLKSVPDYLGFILRSGDISLSGSLNRGDIGKSMQSILVTYQSESVGNWNMIGFLDEIPVKNLPEEMNFQGNIITVLLKTFHHQFFSLAGRPNESYAVTPLMIYRKANPPQEGPVE